MEELIFENTKDSSLSLWNKGVDDDQMEIICLKDCHNIKRLSLGINKITSKGLHSFPLANWNNITVLNLYSNKIGDKGCKYLSKAILNKIAQINLQQNQIGNAGLLHLSKSKWQSLKRLSLYINKFNNDSLKFINSANFHQLQKIWINLNGLTLQQVQKLLLSQFKYIKIIEFGNDVINKKHNKELNKLLKSKYSKFVG